MKVPGNVVFKVMSGIARGVSNGGVVIRPVFRSTGGIEFEFPRMGDLTIQEVGDQIVVGLVEMEIHIDEDCSTSGMRLTEEGKMKLIRALRGE